MIITNAQSFKIEDAVCTYIRVNPGDLSISLREVFNHLADLSWLNKLDSRPLRAALSRNANSTISEMQTKFTNIGDNSDIKTEGGEYIVSVLSKKAVVFIGNHIDVPLMELLGRKKTGNPGFDFYTEDGNPNYLIFCGEAKYQNNRNAYNSCLQQINEFVAEDKHIADITIIRDFVSPESQSNLIDQMFGASAGFSSISSSTDETIIANIKSNPHYTELVKKCKNIYLIAVDLS